MNASIKLEVVFLPVLVRVCSRSWGHSHGRKADVVDKVNLNVGSTGALLDRPGPVREAGNLKIHCKDTKTIGGKLTHNAPSLNLDDLSSKFLISMEDCPPRMCPANFTHFYTKW